MPEPQTDVKRLGKSRLLIHLPIELDLRLRQDATESLRSLSGQCELILRDHYQKQDESEPDHA